LLAERLLRLPRKGNQPVDVVLGDPGRAAEEDAPGPLPPRLPARRPGPLAILAGGTIRGASKRSRDDRPEPRLGEGLAGGRRDPYVARRIGDALWQAAAQRHHYWIVGLRERDHKLSGDL